MAQPFGKRKRGILLQKRGAALRPENRGIKVSRRPKENAGRGDMFPIKRVNLNVNFFGGASASTLSSWQDLPGKVPAPPDSISLAAPNLLD